MKYLTTVEMSEKWNISLRRIGVLCAQNRIEGAIKKGKTWLISADAEKPKDARFKGGNTKEEKRWDSDKNGINRYVGRI